MTGPDLRPYPVEVRDTAHLAVATSPAGPATVTELLEQRDAAVAAVGRVRALLDGRPDHGLIGVGRVRAALDGTEAPS